MHSRLPNPPSPAPKTRGRSPLKGGTLVLTAPWRDEAPYCPPLEGGPPPQNGGEGGTGKRHSAGLTIARITAALVLSLCLIAPPPAAHARRPDDLQPVPDPPAPPAGVSSGEAMPLGQPQITIYRRGAERVKEYRLNGHLYAVKITPDNGAPFYLIDADGDGHMEGRFLDNDNDRVLVPMWVIHRW